MTREDVAGHRGSPGRSRARFEVRARLDDDVVANEPDTESPTDSLDVFGVTRTRRAGVVIDVVHRHVEPGFEGEQEQSQGVWATGHRQIDVGPGVGEVTLRQESGAHFQEVRQRGGADD
jgi:hypothetical protein